MRPIGLDVLHDRRGPYFDLRIDRDRIDVKVLDARPRDRHLLLLSRDCATSRKDKYLCGRDERDWFVAAIPPGSASNVPTALEALKPPEVRMVQEMMQVPQRRRSRRRTRAYIRQGEWFFIPTPTLSPAEEVVLRNEPIRRGNGKPHMVDFVFRVGGEPVYVCTRYPNGVALRMYDDILRRRPHAADWGWTFMRRNAGVYARGRVRHPDHQTVTLDVWHRVVMNTESNAPAMRGVAFLD